MGLTQLLEAASSVNWDNCSFEHFGVDFIPQLCRQLSEPHDFKALIFHSLLWEIFVEIPQGDPAHWGRLLWKTRRLTCLLIKKLPNPQKHPKQLCAVLSTSFRCICLCGCGWWRQFTMRGLCLGGWLHTFLKTKQPKLADTATLDCLISAVKPAIFSMKMQNCEPPNYHLKFKFNRLSSHHHFQGEQCLLKWRGKVHFIIHFRNILERALSVLLCGFFFHKKENM